MRSTENSLVHVLNINPISLHTFPLQKILSFFYARLYMKRFYHIIIITAVLLLFLSCSPTKQFGKIYTSEEADKLFGKVIYSTELSTEIIENLLDKTEQTIMFGIINQNLIILDNKRSLLYPEKAEFKDTDVFTVFKVSLVKELISENGMKKTKAEPENGETVSVEQRREVLSVTYDTKTLETGAKCPPMCDL